MTRQQKLLKKQIKFLKRYDSYLELSKSKTKAADNAFILLVEQAERFLWLEEDIGFEALAKRYKEAKGREIVYNRSNPQNIEHSKKMVEIAKKRYMKQQPLWTRLKYWLSKVRHKFKSA